MRWSLLAIGVGWALAAVVLFLAGEFYAKVHRYDGCSLAILGPEVFYACPVEIDRRPPAEDRDPL